jgi:hypothetical protein
VTPALGDEYCLEIAEGRSPKVVLKREGCLVC